MKKILSLLLIALLSIPASAQKEKLARTVAGFPVNYEEDSAGTYILPDLLTTQSGQKVTDTKTWTDKRRPELVKLFEEQQFGKVPRRPADLRFAVFDKGTPAFGGKAVRKQVRVYFTKDTTRNKMDLLIYLPAKITKPAPLLLVVNFFANSTVVDDPGVFKGEIWTREGARVPAPPPAKFGRLNVDTFVTQGIGIATV